MVARAPATTEAGTRTSCARQVATRHSAAKPSAAKIVISRRRCTLEPTHAVLVDHDMKILHLCRQGLWNFHGKRLRSLWQQRAIHVAVRDPHDLAIVVVKTCDH